MVSDALVTSALNHGRFLHSSGEGHVTVARKAPDFRMRAYEMRDLWEILPSYGGMEDSYISVNRFYGSCAVSRLAFLSSLYSDLDYYRIPDLADMHPRGVTELAFEELERARIPRPSLAVATGRGLALTWRHDPVPRAALPRWTLCQNYIFEALKGLGADASARDAARVMRLVGTRNSKSRTIVEAVWEDDVEGIWTFDELANEILPYTREEPEELRTKCRESRERSPSKDRRRASKSRDDVEKRFTVSVISRAHDAGAGKTVEYNGQRLNPHYHLTNQKIIDMLGITPTEQKKMKTIISKDTKRQRKTERKRQKRRDEGVKPRDEYLDEAEK